MSAVPIPARFPATADDVAIHVMRSFSQHLDLGFHLEFDGRLDPAILERAVRLSLDAQPVLGCALVTRSFSSSWQRVGDLDEHIPFSTLDTDDPERDSVRFRTTPIDDAGPHVLVRLLRARETDYVSAVVGHDAADGQGLKQYAYLLADIYSRLLRDPSYVPVPDLRPRPSAKDVWANLSTGQRAESKSVPSMTMPNWKAPRIAAEGRGRTIRELRVVPERFRAAKEYGSDRGATVNALLLTAFFRAVADLYPPPSGQPMSLPFTVDYRRYLPAATDVPISNVAVSIWLGVTFVPGERFDATLARVEEQLSVWRAGTWGVQGLMQSTAVSKFGSGPTTAMMRAVMGSMSNSQRTSPVFTNIGVLDEHRLRFGDRVPVSARLNGPASFGASLVPTISTYRDELTVSMGFCDGDMDATAIDAVLTHMDKELEGLAHV
jgi:NRPS condensation-like uncharacterized protein